ncbi:phosphate propanoyltransferase [Oleisolibacter albus]|uniref:phosphate propanoyltransferase n=1 Tax=Oleisolibacter albus TaxID=2171757 RepID=UPI000DF44C63|nr:phosphate propanoyltransferase [Oleisolibacter albus]
MELQQDTIERVIRQILGEMNPQTTPGGAQDPFLVPVGVSNRHIHLSRADMEILFGPGAELHRMKAMKQPGQYAAEETVTLKGPKGSLSKVRVLGPVRAETQIEISVADGFTLGLRAPLRMSGQLDDTPGLEIIGPQGRVQKQNGVIVALRHIHMTPATAARLGLRNGQEVDVEITGARGGILRHVAVRAAEASALEMHIDVEEANALGLKNDDLVRIRPL